MVIESTKKVDIKGAGKMKKERVQIPLSKIVIRKLPPTYTEEDFKNAISPVPENNYFAFVPADKGLGPHSYSRAYINFSNPDEILSFRDRFDGYVFVDQKGNEFPALVEYAPFQKVPKYNLHKKDIRCGTVDEDPDYVAYLDLLENPETVILPQMETLLEEIETAERELRANNGVIKIKTPLLEFVEQRNAERFRPGGDRKRRKEFGDRKKIREEEKRRRKDYKEYRKRDEYYPTREERERERIKRKEEEKLKWKEKREEKERLRKERIEKYKMEEKTKVKEFVADGKENTEELPPKDTPNKEEKGKTPPQRTKRYSEVRKKEEKEKKQKEEKSKVTVDSEENPISSTTFPDFPGIDFSEMCPLKYIASEVEVNEVPPPPGLMKHMTHEKEDYEVPPPPGWDNIDRETPEKEEEYEDKYDKEENENDKGERVAYDKGDEDYEDGKYDRDDKSGKDPRTERRIRNKDRPAMQLYRPGQARLKTTRLKPNEEGNEGESSSSSASPIMGVNEEKEKEKEPEKEKEKENEPEIEEKEKNEQDYKSVKGYMGRGGYDRKYPRYRESRGNHHYWDDRESGHSKYKDDYEPSARGRGGTRRGYSYHQERESKGKWVGRSRENDSSQFKSMTFRRSTSQE